MNMLQLDELDDIFLSSIGRGPPPAKFICQISNEVCDEPILAYQSNEFAEPKYYDKEVLMEYCSNNMGRWPGEGEVVNWNKVTVDNKLKQDIKEWKFRNNV